MAKPISALIPKIIRKTATATQTIRQLQQEWTRLVGKELAGHTRPGSLRRKTLYVYTDEPGVSFLLALEKPQLLARLRAHTKSDIEELVIRPGDIEA